MQYCSASHDAAFLYPSARFFLPKSTRRHSCRPFSQRSTLTSSPPGRLSTALKSTRNQFSTRLLRGRAFVLSLTLDASRLQAPLNSLERETLPPSSSFSMGFLVALYLPLYALSALVLLRVILLLRFLLPSAARRWRSLEENLHLHQRYKIPRYNENLQENPLYRKVFTYLSSLPSLEDSDCANVFSSSSGKLSLRLEPGSSMRDSFLGAPIGWSNFADTALILTVRINDKRRILRPYLNHIEAVADELEQSRPELRFFTNCTANSWTSVPFSHPATMETVFMEEDQKIKVRSDLESFLKNKSYYHRLGKVWKRSYLLYGAPGTGKSSFVAAMAKILSYDVYDLDLGKISEGIELRSLLLRTNPRSLIVVEDVDRHLKEGNLGGILGFMEGIFSCCGEERIIVFTINGRKEEIDAGILRGGLFDVQIQLPYCDFPMFKAMAGSFLGLKEHKLYPQVEEIFQAGVSLSESEIGEIMIANKGSPSRAIRTVIGALRESQRGAVGPAGRVGAAIMRRLRNDDNGAGEEREREVKGEDKSGIVLKESAMKDIKKFVGMLKIRGGSRREGMEGVESLGEKDGLSERPSSEKQDLGRKGIGI